jgi:hypothetical protein
MKVKYEQSERQNTELTLQRNQLQSCLTEITDTHITMSEQLIKSNVCFLCTMVTLKPIIIVCNCALGKAVLCTKCVNLYAQNYWYVESENAEHSLIEHGNLTLKTERQHKCHICKQVHQIENLSHFLMGVSKSFGKKLDSEYIQLQEAYNLLVKADQKIEYITDNTDKCIYDNCTFTTSNVRDYIRHIFDCDFRTFQCKITRNPTEESAISHDNDCPRVCNEQIIWGKKSLANMTAEQRLVDAFSKKHLSKCKNRAGRCDWCASSSNRMYINTVRMHTRNFYTGYPLCETPEQHTENHKKYNIFRKILYSLGQDLMNMANSSIPVCSDTVRKSIKVTDDLFKNVKECFLLTRGTLDYEELIDIPDNIHRLFHLFENTEARISIFQKIENNVSYFFFFILCTYNVALITII